MNDLHTLTTSILTDTLERKVFEFYILVPKGSSGICFETHPGSFHSINYIFFKLLCVRKSCLLKIAVLFVTPSRSKNKYIMKVGPARVYSPHKKIERGPLAPELNHQLD